MHSEQHDLAGKTVKIKENIKHHAFPEFGGENYTIEDYWDRVGGNSWRDMQYTNFACSDYAKRVKGSHIHNSEEVLYEKINGMGHLVHVSEIELIEDEPKEQVK